MDSDQWEYTFQRIFRAKGHSRGVTSEEADLTKNLNRLGEQRWEVVYIERTSAYDIYGIFKRRRKLNS